jgi:acetyltransferase-like isoleucine patch superfamily enzyme
MVSKIKQFVSLYKLFFLTIGNKNITINKNGFYCGKNITISKKNKITIGSNFFMGNYCHLAANAIIGNNIMFASHVSLVGGDHKIDDIGNTPIRFSGRDIMKTILIDDDAWIGHGAIIMHGVTIGKGAVVAAGSVVVKNVEPYSIVGGNPAKFIRFRKGI